MQIFVNKTLVFLTLTLLTILAGVASYTSVGDGRIWYGILTFYMFICTTNCRFIGEK